MTRSYPIAMLQRRCCGCGCFQVWDEECEKLNHGSRHGFEGLIRGRLPSLGNDNARNCERNMMSRSNLDEEKMGLDEICGSEGETQMFDMGWMKNG
jgi:hypothetical protein